MPYRTIVVGTDGSPTASVAVEVAQALTKRLRGKLVLVGRPRRLRGHPAAAASRAVRGGRGGASEEGRCDRRADRGHAGRVDPRRRDQARRRPDRRREPRDGAGHAVPAGERSGLGGARRAVRPPDRRHDRSRRPARARPSLHADPRGDRRLGDGDRGRAQGVHARLRVRGLGHARARRRSARGRDQARRGRVRETGGRRGPEAEPSRAIPPSVLCELAESENVQLVVVGNKGMVGRAAVPRLGARTRSPTRCPRTS